MAELIESHNQMICEGKADQVFFSRLLESMGKNVQVACPEKARDGAQGLSAMHRRLQALQAYFDKIERVVLAVDCDDDPTKRFSDGCNQFAKAGKYPIPSRPYVFAEQVNAPKTAIIMVPSDGQKGSLDSLLLKSFEDKYRKKILPCVRRFYVCIGASKRGKSRAAKLKLRALIAASQKKNPGISLAFLLEEKNCPISFSHPSFGAIKAELGKLFS